MSLGSITSVRKYSSRRSTGVGVVFAMLLLAASMLPTGGAHGATGDCGQPVTNGATATATDSLFILHAAIALQACSLECICDVDASADITASDALRSLQSVVGQPVSLDCPCPNVTCTSGVLTTLADSTFDLGRNGRGHDQEFIIGMSVPFDVVRRCVEHPSVRCSIDADCASGACQPACDCDNPAASVCELTGPTSQRRCQRTAEPCTSNADCTTLSQDRCEQFLGPPLPITAGDTPLCVATSVLGDLSGTVDFSTGAVSVSVPILSRAVLGPSSDKPCPRCGAPEESPVVGASYTCEGGPQHGEPCTVEAVSRLFGGMSLDCLPPLVRDIDPVPL